MEYAARYEGCVDSHNAGQGVTDGMGPQLVFLCLLCCAVLYSCWKGLQVDDFWSSTSIIPHYPPPPSLCLNKDSLGIEAVPPIIRNAPDGSTLWGMVNVSLIITHIIWAWSHLSSLLHYRFCLTHFVTLFLQSVFSWTEVSDGLQAVQQSGLLYSLAPDWRAQNQSFLAVTGTVSVWSVESVGC